MLKAMRKNVKQLAPTLWLVIAAFIITIFAVWGGAGRLGEARGTNTLVTVKNDKISADLYFQNLRQRLEALKQQFPDLDKSFIQQLNLPQQVLEQMIQQTILLQKAQELGIKATTDEIRKKIISYPVFQRDGKFVGFEEYKRILEWNRIPLSDFEDSIKQEIIIDKVVDILTAGLTVTPEELWRDYRTRNETAAMEFVVLETDKIELEEEPSSTEIRNHFEKNREKYMIPERREGSLVFFRTEDLKKKIELTEAEIEKYYQSNEAQFREPERVKVSRIYLPYEEKEKELVLAEAQDILEKIGNNEDFGELAKEFSKDDKANSNGDWGLYEWKSLSPEEKEEIERLSEGKNSGVLELEEGLSILKVTEKKPAVTKSLEEVKARIQSILEDQKARELAEERIKSLEKGARREKSLDVAAQMSGLKIQSTGLLKQKEAIEDIDPSGTISTTLFQIQEKEISSPVYTYKGVGIIQLEMIDPARQANFEEVEEEVKEEFINLKKKEMALEKMKRAKREVDNINLEELAEELDLEYKTVNEHKREQYLSIVGENETIDRLAFTLPLNETSEPVEFEQGYILIRVLSRKEVTKDDLEKNEKEEKETLLETKKNRFFQSYMTKLRKDYEVEIKYDLFLKITSDILSRYEKEG